MAVLPGSSVRTVWFNQGTIWMLFVIEPNRLKVHAGKILGLTTSIAAAIAMWKRLINHAPAEKLLFGAPVEGRLWDGCQPSRSRRVVMPERAWMGCDKHHGAVAVVVSSTPRSSLGIGLAK